MHLSTPGSSKWTRFLSLTILFACWGCAEQPNTTPDFVDGELITFTGSATNPNGAWCWFQDERVIVDPSHPDGPMLMFTAISASKSDSTEMGDLDFYWYGLESEKMGSMEFYNQFGQDDHNVAALYQKPNGEVLALYSRHGSDNLIHIRTSVSQRPDLWGDAMEYQELAGVTYNNLLTVGSGDTKRLLNFSRSRGWNPNFIQMDFTTGEWSYGGRLLNSEGRPYMKYAGNIDGSLIHVVATDQHPRNFDNSIYHGVMDGSILMDSFGQVVDSNLSDDEAAVPTQLTRVFEGNADNVAWMADVAVDQNDQPVIAFSVQKDGRDLPPNQGGLDHRYHLARFLDGQWVQHEIAYAGERLYPFEDDYTGLVAIDPQDVNRVVISTNADPVTGEPLISLADQKRHYEIFEGSSTNEGLSFTWTPLTKNSSVDNLRPIIPAWESDSRAVLWLRGSYSSYTDFNTQVVGVVQNR